MKKIPLLIDGALVIAGIMFAVSILFPFSSDIPVCSNIHYEDSINSIDDENLFWEISNEVPTVSPEYYTLTSNISFKQGKNYTYSVWDGRGRIEHNIKAYPTKEEDNIVYVPMNYTLSFFVNECINLNNSKEKWKIKIEKKDAGTETIEQTWAEINKNGFITGSTIGISYVEETFFFSWAAILKENISWKTEIDSIHKRDVSGLSCRVPDCNFSEINIYKVLSFDKFNKRNVFKVEKMTRNYNDCHLSAKGEFFYLLFPPNITIERKTDLIKSFFWIDVDDRTVLKKEVYNNNTLIYKAERLSSE